MQHERVTGEMDANVGKVEWTNVVKLVGCKDRKTNYWMTQTLMNRGSFSSYFKRIDKDKTDEYMYCGDLYDAEHTLSKCKR